MDKHEEYVVGMSGTDFHALDEEAISNKTLDGILNELKNNSRWSNSVRIMENEPFDVVTGARGSLERAKLLREYFANEYKLPIEKFQVYKEAVIVELVE